MRTMFTIAAAAASLVSTTAWADPIIDGTRDTDYGAPTSTVTYDPAAPNSNFGAPTPFSDASTYDIYFIAGTSSVFGFIQSDRVTPVVGANLYFDIDPANGNGSDLGFEITNGRAFVPGMPGYSAGTSTTPLAGLSYAISGDNTGIEFSIANSLFTTPIAGLTYYGGQEFPSVGDSIVLRLSQSFGYSVGGGATYGPNRLGAVALGGAAAPAVPEPASWALMIAGFGLAGGALRRQRQAKVRVAYA